MYRICILLMIIFCFTGCSNESNTLIKSLPDKWEFDGFGPFFLPEGKNFNNIALHYFTKEKEKTSIRFSMIGEIDWLRENKEPTHFHKMIFENLEESAVYRFSIESSHFRREKESVIKTIPYGENFEFEFGIASIEQDLSWEKSPNFLILLSRKEKVMEDSFIPYYHRNKKILSSTIILPMFDLSMCGRSFFLSKNGFYSFRYKNLNIILLYNNFSDTLLLNEALCYDSDVRNYIVVGNISGSFLNSILKDFGNKVENIFVANFLNSTKGIKNINKPYLVKITSKASFVFRR